MPTKGFTQEILKVKAVDIFQCVRTPVGNTSYRDFYESRLKLKFLI